MKRALALLAPAVLTIGLVACGDDDDSPDTTEATTETTEESATDVTGADPTTAGTDGEDGEDASDDGSVSDEQADMMGRLFPNLSGGQVDCLVDELGDDAIDPSQAQDAADACDIDPADLIPDVSAISIPDLSDVSIPGNMDEFMADAFPNLDDEQIDCILEELGEEFDLSQAADLTDTCNIDPADLTPGG